MTDPTPQPDPWTLERKRLHEWLEGNAGRLADVHAAAGRLLDDPSFPGRVPPIAAALREIANGLLPRSTWPVGAEVRRPPVLPVGGRPSWRALGVRLGKLFHRDPPGRPALHPVARELAEIAGWFEKGIRRD